MRAAIDRTTTTQRFPRPQRPTAHVWDLSPAGDQSNLTTLPNFCILLTSGGGAAKPHPLSPTGKMPQITGTQPRAAQIELKPGEVLLRMELSKRFRYKSPSASEMDQIDSGGATLVY